MEALEKLVGIVTPKAPSNVPPSKKDAPTPGKGKDKKPDSDVVPVVPQKPGKSIDPIPNPGKYMEPSEIAQLSHQARFERFSNRMAEFRKLMKQGDIFMLEKGEISRLQNTIGPLKVEMRFLAEALDFTKLTPEHNEYFRRYSTELAQYFSGKSETNDHFRDYTAAIFYAQKSLSEALVRNNITLPQPPTPAAAHQLIFAQNPKLAEKIKIMIGRKIEIGEILSNPKISREFNETWEKIYGKYEKDLQTQLSELKTKETKDGVMMNFKDTYERKAFETLIDTAGAKNRAEWISIGKNIAVIGAAIGATFATGGLALPGILAGAAAGGATMAAGTALSKGQYDTNVSWKNDHVIDFASGALPGAVGGVSAKIASGAITRAVVGTG